MTSGWINKIALVFLVINVTGLTVFSIIVRSLHPELTETELLARYWKNYLGHLVGIALAVAAMD